MAITTPDWVKDSIFYQIFPDRFAFSKRIPKDGLHLEAWDAAPTLYGFKGGDLLGVVEHLDYLQDLGVTALYFNPLFASASNHRYHAYDYHTVDPLLGGNAALRELLDAAHGRGMRVVLDGVFNHASRGFWQFHHVLENGDGSPYVDWFHFNPDQLLRRRHWGAYPTPEEQRLLNQGMSSYDALGYRAWWNLPALPKFNTNTPAVREFILDVAETWIKFGADGWRLDVPAEIDDDSFWQEFRQRVKRANPEAYIVGEIWHEAKRWLQGDQFDAVMNYLVSAAMMGFIIGENMDEEVYRVGGYQEYLQVTDATGFADRIDYILNLYDQAINHVQFNLLDSHDTPRFLTVARGDKTALQLGWFFLLTFPGAPCIYYGDEIGLDGHHDPDCRKSFPWGDKGSWDLSLYDYAKKLIALRRSNLVLRRGTYQRLFAKQDVIAFARTLNTETVVVVMNVAMQPRRIKIPVGFLHWQDGPVRMLFGDGTATVGNKTLRMEIAPRSGMVITT